MPGADSAIVAKGVTFREEHSQGAARRSVSAADVHHGGDTGSFLYLIPNGLGMVPSTRTGEAGEGAMPGSVRISASGVTTTDAEELESMASTTLNQATIWRWRQDGSERFRGAHRPGR